MTWGWSISWLFFSHCPSLLRVQYLIKQTTHGTYRRCQCCTLAQTFDDDDALKIEFAGLWNSWSSAGMLRGLRFNPMFKETCPAVFEGVGPELKAHRERKTRLPLSEILLSQRAAAPPSSRIRKGNKFLFFRVKHLGLFCSDLKQLYLHFKRAK